MKLVARGGERRRDEACGEGRGDEGGEVGGRAAAGDESEVESDGQVELGT